MKPNLFDVIGQVDDDLIFQAEQLQVVPEKRHWFGWASLALAAAIGLFLAWPYLTNRIEPTPVPPVMVESITEPNPTLTETTEPAERPFYTESPTEPTEKLVYSMEFDGMGMEALRMEQATDYVLGTPWKPDWSLTHLPVYRNQPKTSYIQVAGPEAEVVPRLKQRLIEVAKQFGVVVEPSEIQEIYPRQVGFFPEVRMEYHGNKFDITVTADFSARVHFATPIRLPDLTIDYNSPYEDWEKLGDYLAKEYADEFQFAKPEIAIDGGYQFINSKPTYQLSLYDQGDSLLESFQNYSFNRVEIKATGDHIQTMVFHQVEQTDKLGDYPIITPAQAQELLNQGHFITTVWFERATEVPASVELIYRTGMMEDLILPYYRFLVKLVDEQENPGSDGDLYGAFYVPAVQADYLDELPLWDGHFN